MKFEGRKQSDLGTRAIVGIVLIAIAGFALYLGDIAFWLLVSVAAIIMAGEWAGLFAASRTQVRIMQLALAVPLAILSPLADGPGLLALGLNIGVAFLVGVATRKPALAGGVLYVGLPVMALLALRAEPNGLLLAFSAMALVWACDIGAYFAGRTIGGPKLLPKVSPNKTWAGLGGGVTAALAFGLVMRGYGLPEILVFASPLLAVLAQAGDLYESWLKRRAGVKDSGTILPGHGGVLDRLDGLVPVAPVAALLILVFA